MADDSDLMNHLSLEGPVGRSGKSESAFRTISEVSADLGVPQHVLRFWETKFSQIRPMKRGGGRRYYRPEDMRLLEAIRDLLYNDGYTIRGAQKLLRENGLKSVLAAQAEGGTEALAGIAPPDEEGVFIAFNSEMESDPPASLDLPEISGEPLGFPALEAEVEGAPVRGLPPFVKLTPSSAPMPESGSPSDSSGAVGACPSKGSSDDEGEVSSLDEAQRGELDETLRELEDLRRILRQAGL